MQWAHLPPRKKMTRTFLPFWPARFQGAPVVSAPRERLGRERGPDQGAERRQVDPVDGGLVGAGGCWPARGPGSSRSSRPSSGRRSVSRRRKTGRSRSAQRAIGSSVSIGLAGLLLLAGGVEDLDQGGQGRNLVGVLGDGLRGRAFGEPVVAGRQMGPCQGFGPHRGRFCELFERRADLAPGQESKALPARRALVFAPGAGQFLAGPRSARRAWPGRSWRRRPDPACTPSARARWGCWTSRGRPRWSPRSDRPRARIGSRSRTSGPRPLRWAEPPSLGPFFGGSRGCSTRFRATAMASRTRPMWLKLVQSHWLLWA